LEVVPETSHQRNVSWLTQIHVFHIRLIRRKVLMRSSDPLNQLVQKVDHNIKYFLQFAYLQILCLSQAISFDEENPYKPDPTI